jgi:hypothetical protein
MAIGLIEQVLSRDAGSSGRDALMISACETLDASDVALRPRASTANILTASMSCFGLKYR